MLTELNIKNFAIIDSLNITFEKGFNVLTGETGAGKSIIVDAVELVLGGRASSEMIRSGCDEAVVEAAFDISDASGTSEKLSEMGIEGDDALVIKRTVSASGKNKVFINGSMATIAMLSDIGEFLVDIHGQHEHQTLFKVERHIDVIDEYAAVGPLREEMAGVYSELNRVKNELGSLKVSEADKEKRLDLLRFQSDEIGKASLKENEEEGLLGERKLLANSEKLFDAGNTALELLYAQAGSALELVKKADSKIREIATLDESLKPTAESINSVYASIEDAAMTLRDYVGKISFEPERLNEIEERLDLIGRLKRKYGNTVSEVLKYKEEVDRELEGIEKAEERITELEKEVETLKVSGLKIAETLSDKRKKASKELKNMVEVELSDLGMKKAVFEVRIDRISDITAKGLDRMEFLLSSNPGEVPKALSKIASGGELSRIMLALKKVLAGPSGVPSMVFDEVDSGIGGGIAEVVGRKLKEVARGRQVLCITHLPQIAAMADLHYAVSKGEEKGRTVTTVIRLDKNDRVDEIARMLGGMTITEATKRHAEEMIKSVNRET
ncbi:MAG TPA: DNA repair protein RecN [Thermodesulfobacteriota bacterium]|nr:DNA repair protein RecN [Thermodesulfobacteriota bacterium]